MNGKHTLFVWFTRILIGLSGISCHHATNRMPISTVVSNGPAGVIADQTEGIVYFSSNNGLTWQNKSEGLPLDISIGLGGIAASENGLAIISKENGLYFFDEQQGSWVNIPTDRRLIESNPGALWFYKNSIYVGTQFGGVFHSRDAGRSWIQLNAGFESLAIRKFAEIGHRLYAATNAGLYVYNDQAGHWTRVYGTATLQVNGIAELGGRIYIATNQGAFTGGIGKNDWKKVFSVLALHNISTDGTALYAMAYNELFSSPDKGQSWQGLQKGLPAQLYTFNVMSIGDALLAGQWDGVYRMDTAMDKWVFSGHGLPLQLAITNMVGYNGIIVVSGRDRMVFTN